ncbi:TolC family protein [Bryocella elongata]|nr:TolC family protein [Bryocella elongata]
MKTQFLWALPRAFVLPAAFVLSVASALPQANAQTAAATATSQQAATPAITLDEALHRAQAVDHSYVSALADKGTADAQKTIARADLLPNVDYHNQALYTSPQKPYAAANTKAGTTSANPVFIANNTVREYVSQGIVTETVGLGRVTELRRASAEASAAKARLEIARRGLVATVVGDFYTLLAAEQKARVSNEALAEANRFSRLTGQLEAGGEVAHADTIKARLQQQQREREQQDAQLAAESARLDLGVLLFADPTTPYTVAADLEHPSALPARAEIEANAKSSSPDVRAAFASLRAADLGVTSSRAAYLPDLALAYNYGIDSDHFTITDSEGIRNLGYSAQATLDIPVWDWFATHAKVKESELQRDLAKADLTIAQRRVIAQFQQFYNEADVASRQITSLQRSVDDAKEALRLTTLRYSNGEGAILEVVDAQNTLVGAQTAQADGVVRYYTALANLQTLTGTLP